MGLWDMQINTYPFFVCGERERAGALNLSNQVKILTGVIIEVFDKLNSFF
jgi:hypothetical protein